MGGKREKLVGGEEARGPKYLKVTEAGHVGKREEGQQGPAWHRKRRWGGGSPLQTPFR